MMIETTRLYYEDVYQKEFCGKVQKCCQVKDKFEVILDQSAFYPEGGGQPCDLGTLNGVCVTDVQEKDGELLHYTDQFLEPGTEVTGKIDWSRRFDLMQQHSGEHIVSGLVHEKYGYDNVGFHMGSDVITIDFNGMLTMEQLSEIEKKVNEKIWENSSVEVFYPQKEELDQLPYRSKKELTGKIRLVRFPGADLCACCGTHVTYTGEIGMVKILSVEKFREGVRVEMICGNRISKYLDMVEGQNHEISIALSARPDKTAEAVARVQEELFQVKGQLLKVEEKLFNLEAEKYAGCGDVLLFSDGMEADRVRRLADMVMQNCGGCCAVFSKAEDQTYKYAIGYKDGDLRQFVKELNAELNGRGGGRPFFVQGSVQAKEKEIRGFWEKRRITGKQDA